MNQALEHQEVSMASDTAKRKRVETVVETLANIHSPGGPLAAVAHDARNMVTALGLYCDLLEEPGVLAAPFAHYGSELRLVAAASRRLIEKLVLLDAQAAFLVNIKGAPSLGHSVATARFPARSDNTYLCDTQPAPHIANLANELVANCNLLAAFAGPAVTVTVDTEGGERPVRLTAGDLTRVLVNLVKNAAEAMPSGGHIHIALCEAPAAADTAGWLALSIVDNGPGIPQDALEKVFEPGFTTHGRDDATNGGWLAAHRGLGLSITRSIVEGVGGRIHAANRTTSGARFEIELPVWTR
jgi:signal transduction histidine kinase